MNTVFYEIIEGQFQLLGLDLIPPLSFPEEEICKPLRGLGAAREGVAMDERRACPTLGPVEKTELEKTKLTHLGTHFCK